MADHAKSASDQSLPTEEFTLRYRYYVLAVLMLCYIFNFIDRQILVILQESIKADLGLSDTQLGLLSGLSFALFYVTVGIPVARWADRGVRRDIIALAVGTWSFMTMACGMAQNYVQLLLARIGVGVGESGGSPPAHSIISDIFPPEQRATALSIYSMGINFGVLFGFVIGGWVNDWLGWRMAFLAVGIPGILVALLVRGTVREPPRGLAEQVKKNPEAPPLADVFKLLWSRRSFRHISLAAGMHAFAGYGITQWMGSFLIRAHDLQSTGEVGTWLGIISGTAGALGTFTGGLFTDRLSRRDVRWYVWFPAMTTLAAVPFMICVYLLDNLLLVLWIYAIPVYLNATFLGPTLAITHSIVSLRMRALASAVLFFVLNLIGLGVGPLFVGILSDLLQPSLGNESLRWALIIALLAYVWCTLHYLLSARHLREDLANAPR